MGWFQVNQVGAFGLSLSFVTGEDARRQYGDRYWFEANQLGQHGQVFVNI